MCVCGLEVDSWRVCGLQVDSWCVCGLQVSGLETDLASLWQAVESLGGLQQVIDKHRWNKVVEMLKIPKIVSSVSACCHTHTQPFNGR